MEYRFSGCLGSGGWPLMDSGFFCGDDKNALELDCGDDCGLCIFNG